MYYIIRINIARYDKCNKIPYWWYAYTSILCTHCSATCICCEEYAEMIITWERPKSWWLESNCSAYLGDWSVSMKGIKMPWMNDLAPPKIIITEGEQPAWGQSLQVRVNEILANYPRFVHEIRVNYTSQKKDHLGGFSHLTTIQLVPGL